MIACLVQTTSGTIGDDRLLKLHLPSWILRSCRKSVECDHRCTPRRRWENKSVTKQNMSPCPIDKSPMEAETRRNNRKLAQETLCTSSCIKAIGQGRRAAISLLDLGETGPELCTHLYQRRLKLIAEKDNLDSSSIPNNEHAGLLIVQQRTDWLSCWDQAQAPRRLERGRHWHTHTHILGQRCILIQNWAMTPKSTYLTL